MNKGYVQLIFKKPDNVACYFCEVSESRFELRGHKANRLPVEMCLYCAEKLALAFNAIEWKVQK